MWCSLRAFLSAPLRPPQLNAAPLAPAPALCAASPPACRLALPDVPRLGAQRLASLRTGFRRPLLAAQNVPQGAPLPSSPPFPHARTRCCSLRPLVPRPYAVRPFLAPFLAAAPRAGRGIMPLVRRCSVAPASIGAAPVGRVAAASGFRWRTGMMAASESRDRKQSWRRMRRCCSRSQLKSLVKPSERMKPH